MACVQVNLAFTTHLVFCLIHVLISVVVVYMEIQDGRIHSTQVTGQIAATLQ